MGERGCWLFRLRNQSGKSARERLLRTPAWDFIPTNSHVALQSMTRPAGHPHHLGGPEAAAPQGGVCRCQAAPWSAQQRC